jgi:adenylosuccinate lyase
VLDETAIRLTFEKYAPFACTERVLMAMAKAGADRQETHERLRRHALFAWAEIKTGKENPLVSRIASDEFFGRFTDHEGLASLMNADAYLGDSVERAKSFADTIKRKIAVLD